MTEDNKTPEAEKKKPDAEKTKTPPTGKDKVKAKAKDVNPPSFVMSSSPHVRTRESIESAMFMVVLALIPAFISAVIFFGYDAIRVTALCIFGCLAIEGAWLKKKELKLLIRLLIVFVASMTIIEICTPFCPWLTQHSYVLKYLIEGGTLCIFLALALLKGTQVFLGGNALNPEKTSIFMDGSAFLTGLLLAFNLPANAPWWLCLAGAFVAMIIAKHVFGGLGANPFNPALVARIFLLIAWPAQMTSWPIPGFASEALKANPDGITAATPLGVLATDGLAAMQNQFSFFDVMVGKIGGSLGETSAFLLLAGGILLIARGVIRWHIPVAYIVSFGLLSGIFWIINPDKYADPFFHIAAGGLLLGAFFMATDYTTSPLSTTGMLIFGIGCGVITFVIRYFGSFPEGVSFSIVIMNAFTPLIDRKFVPKRFGIETTTAKAA